MTRHLLALVETWNRRVQIHDEMAAKDEEAIGRALHRHIAAVTESDADELSAALAVDGQRTCGNCRWWIGDGVTDSCGWCVGMGTEMHVPFRKDESCSRFTARTEAP